MTTQYFAQLDENNVVVHIAVTSTEFMASNPDRYPGIWIETFLEVEGKHCAGVGYTYDADADAFIAPQPYPSWLLDGNYDWQAPIAYPADGKDYSWDEANQVWVESLAS